MREILFKGKYIGNGKWVEGFYYKTAETTYCFKEDYERNPIPVHHYILKEKMTDWGLPNEVVRFEIDPATLCEYTGRTDRNGNKIFENDILKAHLDDECPENVTFEKVEWNGFGWILHEPGCIDQEYMDYTDMEIFEVTGNSFDNPDLLKETK